MTVKLNKNRLFDLRQDERLILCLSDDQVFNMLSVSERLGLMD